MQSNVKFGSTYLTILKIFIKRTRNGKKGKKEKKNMKKIMAKYNHAFGYVKGYFTL